MVEKYDLDNADNILRAREDSGYMGLMIEHNSKLIWHTLHSHLGDLAKFCDTVGVEKADLFQIGCLGFMDAIHKYDPSKGYAFSTYATFRIVGEVKDFNRKYGSIVGFSRNYMDAVIKVADCLEGNIEGTYLPESEIAGRTGLDTDIVREVLSIGTVHLPITSDRGSQEGVFLDDVSNTECFEDSVIEDLHMGELVGDIEQRLDSRGLNVFRMRLSGKTVKSMAKSLGLAEVTIFRSLSQIKEVVGDILDLS